MYIHLEDIFLLESLARDASQGRAAPPLVLVLVLTVVVTVAIKTQIQIQI